MIRNKLFLAFCVLMGMGTVARAEQPFVHPQTLLSWAPQARMQVLDWRVGDSASYKMSMGFIQGSMNAAVTEETDQGFWMVQQVDLPFIKQKIETHLDKNTGALIELRINGKKQDLPGSSAPPEVLEMKEDQVTVPKGTFDCIYLKLKDTTTNMESEVWVNPEAVPLSGMLKTVQPLPPVGAIVIELVDFNKVR